jgi:hypothetical protein
MTVVIYDVASDSGVRCNNILELAHGLRHFQPERWMSLNKFYAVSDWGRVKQTQKNRLLKQYRNGNGYACVRFTGDKYNSPVHKLVLPKFRPRIDYSPDAKKSYPFIDHINHNRMDACLGNLRYSNNALNQMNRRSVNGYYEKKKAGVPTGRYCAAVRMHKKNTSLGTFGSTKKAGERYREAIRDAFEVLEY